MLYNLIEIEAIKLAVNNLDKKISANEVILKSIDYLEEKYVETKDHYYLQKAVWHIYAYIELCDSINEEMDLFERVLKYKNLSFEHLFQDASKNYKEIVVNKINITNLLGRWNPALHSMKIEEAVDDIISKISKREIGEYLYHCGKNIKSESKKKLWEHTYILYVNKNSNLFFDVNKKRYFLLKEKC